MDGDKRVFCWVVFDRGMEAQPALPAPTGIAANLGARLGPHDA